MKPWMAQSVGRGPSARIAGLIAVKLLENVVLSTVLGATRSADRWACRDETWGKLVAGTTSPDPVRQPVQRGSLEYYVRCWIWCDISRRQPRSASSS